MLEHQPTVRNGLIRGKSAKAPIFGNRAKYSYFENYRMLNTKTKHFSVFLCETTNFSLHFDINLSELLYIKDMFYI